MKLFNCLILLLLFFGCDNSSSQNDTPEADGQTITVTEKDTAIHKGMGYHLTEPAKTYILPASLEEISGMQSIGERLVACVQDEKGILFIFDYEEGKLVQEISWGDKGDYEGVAGNASSLYVLESNGAIYQISNYSGVEKARVKKWKTELEKPCDAEGLYFLEEEAKLLIACKEGTEGVRNIWAFDLQQERLLDTPYMQIPQEGLENELVEEGIDRFSLGLKKMLDAKGESGILASSGIAQHPISKDFYILSSQSKLLVVISPAGKVKYIEELGKKLFKQPESITFTPAGDMLIGNEAKGGEPNILRFTYDK